MILQKSFVTYQNGTQSFSISTKSLEAFLFMIDMMCFVQNSHMLKHYKKELTATYLTPTNLPCTPPVVAAVGLLQIYTSTGSSMPSSSGQVDKAFPSLLHSGSISLRPYGLLDRAGHRATVTATPCFRCSQPSTAPPC